MQLPCRQSGAIDALHALRESDRKTQSGRLLACAEDPKYALLGCRHPLLHADYLTSQEASKRQEGRPKSASGPLRRLATRKDVMAQQTGAASDVSV